MGETAELLTMIALVASGETGEARALATRMLAQPQLRDDVHARVLVGVAFSDYIDCRFADALVTAERALTVARASGSKEAQLHALSMRMLATAGLPWAGEEPQADYFALAWGMRDELARLDVESRMIAAHFLAEGALATGRISEAVEVLDELGDIRAQRSPEDEARVPYLPFMQIQRARVLIFSGAMADALPVAQRATEESRAVGNAPCAAVGEALVALIEANLDDRAVVRRIATTIERALPEPRGLLEGGAWIICAFALFAIGDRARAAQFVLVAGGGPDLRALQVVDRALGYDILVTDALDRDDLEAASEWGEHSLPLAAHPGATVVVEHMLARLDGARGDSSSAAERAGVAAARARLTGRYLDAARADMIRARALASAGLHDGAVAQFAGVAYEAERAGIPGIRRSATRELRLLGRRLPPPPGGGWSSLTERERQIAVLAAEGFSNQVIGATLFLSGRTVQSYMSRVLAALGISSRAALPRHVAELRLGSPRDDLPALTPRQWQVAALVAEGLSNQDVAARLGISVKTTEKHIGEILQRWGVTSRTSIAHLVVAETMRSAG